MRKSTELDKTLPFPYADLGVIYADTDPDEATHMFKEVRYSVSV